MDKKQCYIGKFIEEEVFSELLTLDYRLRVNETLLEFVDVSNFVLETTVLEEKYADCDWYKKVEEGSLYYKEAHVADVRIEDEEGHPEVTLSNLQTDIVTSILHSFYDSLIKEKLATL